MKPGAFLLILRPTEGGFEALLQCRAEHMRDAGTWGLIGGELDPMERWLYTSAGVADDLRCRVLRRAALREALEEMGGASEMPQTQILFEPMCVQVSSDGQAVRLPRSSGAWPVPAGLAFFELDAQRSRCLRVGYMDTFVFVYVMLGWMAGRAKMIHVLSSTGRLLLALDPDLFRARNAGDRSLLEDMPALGFTEIVKDEVRARKAIPYLRQKLMHHGRVVPFHLSWEELEKPREVELHVLDYVNVAGDRLRQMAEAGLIEEAEACLMLPQEPNAADQKGETAALKASREGHMEMMQLLAYADADLNMPDLRGNTPLIEAARRGHRDIAEFLLESPSVDQDHCNAWGEFPAYLAANHNHHEILRLLLDAKAHKDKPLDDGTTPLIIAATVGHAESVSALLRSGASKNKADLQGVTPLFAAAEAGHSPVVHLLLQAGADRYKATSLGQAPLFAAAQAGHHETVKLLVEGRRGDKDARYNGATALYVAALKGHVEVVNCLIEAGVDKDAATPSNETPLFVAALRNQDEIVRILTRAHADLNKATVDGATPLLVAAQEGHRSIVRTLLEAGADHSKRMLTGETPIALAKDDVTKDLFFTTRTIRPNLSRMGWA
ncbi:unnamed protein product [Effrenium voratum]|uniref:Uncharacterized protein n=1 Tax=Effrenium voratum TaxID=2562239 RepID=A0AA36J6R0_9DINO|nr:unnamed protein product [Effrenium voratum]